MATVQLPDLVITESCEECHEKLTDGVCLNADCPKGQATATEDAARATAKVAVKGATSQPRSFNVSGGVD